MPAAGLPVASITTSVAGCAIALATSSVTNVMALRAASSSEPAPYRSRGPPTRCSAAREERSGERVGFHVHHHDVLAVPATGEHVIYSRRGTPGRVDHDFGCGMGDRRVGVVGHQGGPVARGFLERARRMAIGAPPHPGKRCVRAIGREVGHGDHVDSGRAPRLREVHGAELPRTHQHDADGPFIGLAGREHAMEVHTVGMG